MIMLCSDEAQRRDEAALPSVRVIAMRDGYAADAAVTP